MANASSKAPVAAGAAKGGRVPVAGKPAAPITKATTTSKGNPASRPAKPQAAAVTPPKPTAWVKPREGYTKGVGGQCYFKLAVATRNTGTGAYAFDNDNAVLFEMAPARRSFADKQGQTVPGVGAGMDFSTRTNIAKLNVPGARPLYQHMGIAEERIEFVGSFIGFDEYLGDQEGPTWDTGRGDNHNAWEKSQRLAYAVRAGKEMGLFLGWEDPSNEVGEQVTAASSVNQLNGLDHPLRFDNTHVFRGYVHSIVRTYATAQRVYYRVSFIVTNHEDVLTGPASSNKPVPLPGTLATFSDYAASNTPENPQGQDPNNAGGTAPATGTGQASGTVAVQPPSQPTPAPVVPASTAVQQQALSNLQKVQGISARVAAKEAAQDPTLAHLSPAEKQELVKLGAQVDELNARLPDGVRKVEVDALADHIDEFYTAKVLPTGRGVPAFKTMTDKSTAVIEASAAYGHRPVPVPTQPPMAAAPARPAAAAAPAKPAQAPPKAAAAARPVEQLVPAVAGTTSLAGSVQHPVFGSALNTELRQAQADANSLLVSAKRATNGIDSQYLEKEAKRVNDVVVRAGTLAVSKRTQMGQHDFLEVSKGLGGVATTLVQAREVNQKKLAKTRGATQPGSTSR